MGDRAGKAAGEASAFRAFREAREAGDAELMVQAALSLPSGQRFGAFPGQVPALVYEAYAAAAEPVDRCRLAAALARAWVYGGGAGRAARVPAKTGETPGAGGGQRVPRPAPRPAPLPPRG